MSDRSVLAPISTRCFLPLLLGVLAVAFVLPESGGAQQPDESMGGDPVLPVPRDDGHKVRRSVSNGNSGLGDAVSKGSPPRRIVAPVSVTIPDTTVATGDTVTVPVRVSNLDSAADVTAYEFVMAVDDDRARYVGFEAEGTLSEAADFSISDNPDRPKIGAFGTQALNNVADRGVMLRLKFVVDQAGSTEVSLDPFMFNEGSPEADPSTPSFTVVGTTNTAPTAEPDRFSTTTDQSLRVDPPGVLGNDSDSDGDSLTASLVSDVSNGTLTLNADGSFTYSPSSDFSGTDEFTYAVADGRGGSDQATVTIDVVHPVSVEVPDTTAAPDDTLSVPIRVSNLEAAADVLSYSFTLQFDSKVLAYAGFETEGTLSEAANFTVNHNPDIPKIGAFGSQALSDVANQGVLLRIKLAVQGTDSSRVALDDLSFNEGMPIATPAVPHFVVDASVVPGDVSGGGSVSQFDAALVLQFVVGLIDFSTRQKQTADVQVQNGALALSDNGVSAFDASLISRAALGVLGGSGKTLAQSPSSDGAGQLRLGTVNRSGQTATVPIILEEASAGIQSVSLTVQAEERARVVAVEPHFPKQWLAEHNVTEDGTLRIGMAGATALSPGQIGTIRLSIPTNRVEDRLYLRGTYRLNGGSKVALEAHRTPDDPALSPPSPNPVSEQVTIDFALNRASDVRVAVYDVLGRRVATLVDTHKPAGQHEVVWPLSDQIRSGIYFYRMTAGDFTATRRMTVVR